MINNLYIEYKLLLRFSIGHCLCTYTGIRLSESDCHLICRTYVHTKARLEVEMGSMLTHHFGLSNVGIDSSQRLLQVDFTSLRDPVSDYASHTSIAPTHVQLLTACAVHYDLDFGLVTRYLGGEYTAE